MHPTHLEPERSRASLIGEAEASVAVASADDVTEYMKAIVCRFDSGADAIQRFFVYRCATVGLWFITVKVAGPRVYFHDQRSGELLFEIPAPAWAERLVRRFPPGTRRITAKQIREALGVIRCVA